MWAWGYRWSITVGLIAAMGLMMVNCGGQRDSIPAATARINPAMSTGLLGGWDGLGYQPGDIVDDFVLYSEDGNQFRLSEELAKGKPLLLTGASYTCDVSRRTFPAIRNLRKKFGDDVSFFVVYTTEAHPSDIASPYSPDQSIWIAEANERDGVEAEQPKTYKERVELSRIFKSRNYVPQTVLVDTPNNYFWSRYGQAPNMMYIILPDRRVYFKQTWFEEKETERQLIELLSD